MSTMYSVTSEYKATLLLLTEADLFLSQVRYNRTFQLHIESFE